MVVEKGYKLTEVGVIPEVWDCFSVRQLIDLLTDYDANGSFESVATNVDVYDFENFAWYVRSTDLENNSSLTQVKYVDEKSYKFLKKTSLFGGELLFLKRGDIGNVYLFEMRTEKATLAPNLYLLKLNNVSIPKYLYYFFTSDTGQRQLKSKNASSTLGALYKDDVKSIIVPLPPLPEQTAIANALSDMDALIAQTEKLIEKKKAIKQGVMQELLKPKEGWVTKKLGEVCEIIMGQSPLSEYYNFTGIGLPLIQGNADIKNRKTITRTYSSNITKKGKLGDIIMTVRAPVGEIAISSFECCLGRGVCALRYENDFMYHYLISMENYWSRLSSGSTFDSVNSSQIRDLPITLPGTKKEQIEIAKTLTDLDKDIELTETKLQKLKLQKQGMMQALLTGKIRLI